MNALSAALVEAQKTMPAVKKTGRNPHFNSEFVTLDHLIAKTKPHLAKHGLTIIQELGAIDTNPALTTTLIHESGEQLSSTMPLPAVVDMQKFGAAVTYARRYAWASLLGISDEDDDGNNAVQGSGATPSASDAQPASGGSARTGAGSGSGTGSASTFTWPFGKHKGKPLADTPDEYLDWFLEKSDKEDIKETIRQYRGDDQLEAEIAQTFDAALVGADDDIPFAPTIDGLGN